MTDFERIGTLVPLDSTAAKVTAKGTHYEPKFKACAAVHSDVPPPMRNIPALNLPDWRDLPGKKFGRFAVLGLAAEYNPKKGARWVVRCSCGSYEIRATKAIRNPENSQDCCKKCRHLIYIKKEYSRIGGRSFSEFIGSELELDRRSAAGQRQP